MKNKLLYLAMVVICAAIFASGTVAYFTAQDEARNVITSGGVNILIEEWQETADGLIPYPKEPVKTMPGVRVNKIATIKNLEAEAYVRAKVVVEVTDKDGKEIQLSYDELSSLVTLNLNEKDWIRKEGDSEWWYYKTSLAAGETTEELFSEVIFGGSDMTDEYQNSTFEIIVKAQAVQADNNGDSVLQAAGWPEK